MKRMLRLLLIAGIVVAVLAGTLVALLYMPEKAEQGERVFSDHAATDIVSVHIQNGEGEFTVSAEDGGYVIDDVPSELVDIETFIGFMVACSDVSAIRRIDTGALALSDFGLDEPQATVTVTYHDGGEMTLLLGDEEPLSGDYYCAVPEERGVYLLAKETAENYRISKQLLVSFSVTPKLQVSSALSALADVTFTGGTLASPITIESVSAGDAEVRQLARSFGAATHIVRSAGGVHELDQTYGLTVLTPLCGLTAQAIVYYNLSAAQEDAMGFDNPYMQVDFDYRPSADAEAAHYALRLLPAREDGSAFYANVAGSGVVYVVAREAFVDIAYEKLLLRWFLSPLLMDISGVAIEADGRTTVFSVDNTDKKNPVVTRDGDTMDIEQFRSLFKLLVSAANDGVYLGVQPEAEGAPVMRITYHYTDGKADDVLALYPGETRRVRAYVNDVCEFAMKDTFVERVNEALDAIDAGAAFDVNW